MITYFTNLFVAYKWMEVHKYLVSNWKMFFRGILLAGLLATVRGKLILAISEIKLL